MKIYIFDPHRILYSALLSEDYRVNQRLTFVVKANVNFIKRYKVKESSDPFTTTSITLKALGGKKVLWGRAE